MAYQISSLLTALQQGKQSIVSAINDKGVTVSTSASLSNIATAIRNIPQGSTGDPNLVGWLEASDVIRLSNSFDMNGDSAFNISDLPYAMQFYSSSATVGEFMDNDLYVDDSFTTAPRRGIKAGWEMCDGLSYPPVLVHLSPNRWALVDVSNYLDNDELSYSVYAVYDGKPNFSQQCAA